MKMSVSREVKIANSTARPPPPPSLDADDVSRVLCLKRQELLFGQMSLEGNSTLFF